MERISANQIFNGTFATLWIDDEKMAELTGVTAKIELETEDVKFCGNLASDRKVVGWKGTGSVKFNKVSSKWTKNLGEALKKGIEQEHTLILLLDDPAANGQERVAIHGVKFNDLELMNVEVGALCKHERAFAFNDFEYLDSVE